MFIREIKKCSILSLPKPQHFKVFKWTEQPVWNNPCLPTEVELG